MSSNLIKFVSYDEGAAKFYPPIPANKMIPEWYKEVPNELEFMTGYIEKDGVPSIKRCVPVLDYLTSGYIIRSPYQVKIRLDVDDLGIVECKTITAVEGIVSQHPYQQCPVHMDGVKNHYFKLANVWKVITPPGYSCMYYQPHYFLNNNFQLFPSIVDTDGHDDAVNFVGLAKAKSFVINPGDPLMIVYPFKRDDWNHEVEYNNYTQKNRYKFMLKKMWHGTYSKMFHSKKKFR
jgi:hypothetical protein